MNIIVELNAMSQQIAAYEATKGTTVVVAGDVGAPTRELRDCLRHVNDRLTKVAQYVVSHHVTESRYIPEITQLMDRVQLLNAQRYPVQPTDEQQLNGLKQRIARDVVPEPSPDGR